MSAPVFPSSSGNELVRQIADEIEASEGLYLMGTKRQLGIAKTAVVIGVLRNALDAARSPQAQAGETYSGQTATNIGATFEVVGTINGVAQASRERTAKCLWEAMAKSANNHVIKISQDDLGILTRAALLALDELASSLPSTPSKTGAG